MAEKNREIVEMKAVTEQIISFEEDSLQKFMSYKVDGFHLWPIIRTAVFYSVFDSQIEDEDWESKAKKTINYSQRILLAIAFFKGLLFHNPFFCGHKEFVFFSADVLRRKADDLYVNVIYDYLTAVLGNENVICIEEMSLAGHREPVPNPICLKYYEVIRLAAKPLKRKYANNQTISDFKNLVFKKIKSKWGDKTDIRFDIAEGIASSLATASVFRRLIFKLKPKIVFLEDACYGLHHAVICKICKEYKVPLVEFQHGRVNNHFAYTYPNDIGEYSFYLPDYFFTFGRYWTGVLERLPCVKYSIGYPYLAEYIKSKNILNTERTAGSYEILFISDGIYSDENLRIAKELARLMPDCKIYVRPHPLERLNFSNRDCFIDAPNMSPSKHDDLYADFCDSDAVVGYCSTALFEACAFSKPIYVWDGPMSGLVIPREIGDRFNTAAELADKIRNGADRGESDSEKYYCLDWERNFAKAVNDILNRRESG